MAESMRYRKLSGKALHSLKILREEGLLSLFIIVLISIQTKMRRRSGKWRQNIYAVVKYKDALNIDLNKRPPKWEGANGEALGFNWIMPPPGKGSGGHLNIYRFIKYLEEAGHKCRIYLYTEGQHGTIRGVLESMGNSYPDVKASMEWLEQDSEMADADAIFCTSWETAYAAYNSKLAARRFYFVQDFEPYFYPVGTYSVLAENTYKFGFFGITAGGWLSSKLSKEYGMKTDHYDFGSDTNRYKYVNEGDRKEILFYARPFTDRRGFQIGVMALDIFHRKHPEYTINFAGWDISDYKIPFPFNNLKTLELDELNDLYNRCAASLILSFTNMSLLPLEVLGSGCIPVVNDGENNRLVSDNRYIAYSANDPMSLAKTLSDVVTRKDLPKYALKASESAQLCTWNDAGKRFVGIVEKEMAVNG